MLTEEQMNALALHAVNQHKAGQNPLQLVRQKWAAMTPEQKAEHEAQASAWATAQEKQRRAAAGET
jgi:hypothetical protein